jgi:hydrogenase expression/formation protein HypD
VVFFVIGFETTAPANAMTVWQARQLGICDFSLLVSQVRVPPPMASILRSPHNCVQGFLGPGHVCAAMGCREYEAISARYWVPIVITGFEPLDILEGILKVVRQLEDGRAEVENQYNRVVKRAGNGASYVIMWQVFEGCDQKWRGVGVIPKSGDRLREKHRAYNAAQRFAVEEIDAGGLRSGWDSLSDRGHQGRELGKRRQGGHQHLWGGHD